MYASKQFTTYIKLSNSITDKNELYDCFMKNFDKFIKKLSFYFNFSDCFYLNYRLQSLKNEFCITNVLCHLLFCCRSPNSGSQRRLCSHLFVENANDFVSSMKYHFSLIFFNNKVFRKEMNLVKKNLKKDRNVLALQVFNIMLFFCNDLKS